MSDKNPQKPILEFLEKPREPEDGEQSNDIWMVSFADMISLLLAFFLLMYASSVMEQSKWKEISGSLATKFNPKGGAEGAFLKSETMVLGDAKVPVLHEVNLEYTYAVWRQALNNVPLLQQHAHVSLEGDRLRLSLPVSLVFAGGVVKINEAAQPIILQLAQMLYRLDTPIEIVGAVDISESENSLPEWPSLWELSLARAMTLARELEQRNGTRTLGVYGSAPGKTLGEKKREENTNAATIDIVIRRTS
jgi:chemotaxis protein MotB